MKSFKSFCAGFVLIATLPAFAFAQTVVVQSGSSIVDSTNKQLQRGGKPPKGVVTTQVLVAQPNTKPKRAALPVLAPATNSIAASARVTPVDSAKKSAPLVQRAPVTGKKKPPVN